MERNLNDIKKAEFKDLAYEKKDCKARIKVIEVR